MITDRLRLGLRSPLPSVLQTEASECGLACIAMVAHFHGLGASLLDLRREYGVSLKGATLKDLVDITERLGFSARPVRLELAEIGQLPTPCILHWDLNHFVVLARTASGSVVVHDPAVGVRRVTTEELSRHFTGVALELTPTERFHRAAAPPAVPIKQLLGRVRGIGKALGQLLTLALILEIFAMVSPFFLVFVIDHVLVAADRDLLTTLLIGFGLLLGLQVSVSALRGWLLMGLNASWRLQARGNLFRHLLDLPAAYFETRHLGDVMSRFSSQDVVLNAITTEMIEACLDGLMAGITLALMFVLAPHLALVVLSGAVVYAMLRWALFQPLRDATAELIIWGAKRDTHFLETLRGVRTVKLYNAQEERRTRWLNLLVETINRQLTTEKLRLLFNSARQLLLGAVTLVVVFLGARRVLDNTFTVGLLIAFIAYKDQFMSRVGELINRAVELRMLRLHAERLADIALTEPEPSQGEAPHGVVTRRPDRPSSIELRNVSFRYSTHEPFILRDLSFRIEAGESVAIVGPSGAGKSTLVKLLSGLLSPEHGEILIDDQPVKRVGMQRYRSMLGVVMQDDQLFAGSIADNISFFADDPDAGQIEGCAKLAAVHDDIVAMPMGYATLIGDMGTVLSGGQKQRVLLARALYRRPGVLVLDEATSHLDVERERAVNDAMQRLAITRIIIAHRPETIRSAGRIISLPEINRLLSETKGERGRDAEANHALVEPAL